MRISVVPTALKTVCPTGTSVFLWGSPGIGKSSIVRAVANETGRKVFDIRLSQRDSVDLRGIPQAFVSETGANLTRWLAPSDLPRESDGPSILFLDEINQAPQSVQAAAYQLILDRALGDYVVPDDCWIVAAGNRVTDGANANKIGSALKNRFIHIDVEYNNDDWLKWAIESDINPAIVGFIRFDPLSLNEFEQQNQSADEKKRIEALKTKNAFATPRTWEFMHRQMPDDNSRLPAEIEQEIINGTIGERYGHKFAGFLKVYRNMPDLDQILLNPKTAVVPKDKATLYALASGLATRITPDNCDSAFTYLERLPDKEFQVMCVKDATGRQPKLTGVKSFLKWMLANKDVMM